MLDRHVTLRNRNDLELFRFQRSLGSVIQLPHGYVEQRIDHQGSLLDLAVSRKAGGHEFRLEVVEINAGQ